MNTKNVCKTCGGEIQKDRLAVLDTDLCQACAEKTEGNILKKLVELKPCPFCNAAPFQDRSWSDTVWYVRHDKKCILTKYHVTVLGEDDFSAWNTRADERKEA